MAILKHIAVKNGAYSDAELYLKYQHDEKTKKPILDEKGHYVERSSYLYEGINCNKDTFSLECRQLNRSLGKNGNRNDVKAHHYIISFDPKDDVTMEQAMQIGKEFVEENLSGHQAILVVHPDGHNGSKNIHCHIVINSVRKFEAEKRYWHQKPSDYKLGCKHRSTGMNMHHMKAWVMNWCIKKGFHQVDLFSSKKRKNYWVTRRGRAENSEFQSNKDLLRHYIDEAVANAYDFEDMVGYLKQFYEMEIRVTNKTISFKLPDMKQAVRGRKLGDDYDKAILSERVKEAVKKRNMPYQKYIETDVQESESIVVAYKQEEKILLPQEPQEYGIALKQFMKEHPQMDMDELVDNFSKEYYAKWDEYDDKMRQLGVREMDKGRRR